jgi:hypothetical protein
MAGHLRATNGMIAAAKRLPVPAIVQLIGVAQQVAHLDWASILQALNQAINEKVASDQPISFSELFAIDNMAADLAHGVCPLPLYQFTDSDWELFIGGTHIEEIRQRLRVLNVFQYFFPPADQLALGIAERGITKRNEITEIVASAPAEGHPFGSNELIFKPTDVVDIVDRLSENSFINEVDHSVKLTTSGTTSRLMIRATPREGVISKLITRFKFNMRLSTKDIWQKP